MINKESNNKYLADALRATGRKGVEEVLRKLWNEHGFFNAPASSAYHLNEPGGLVQHSINVYNMAMKLREVVLEGQPELADHLPVESIAITALLHDVCKSDVYQMKDKFRKDANGRWETYQGYEVDYSRFPMGHGEKSVIMLLQMGLELTEEEMMAIRWHMSAWDLAFQSSEEKSSLNAARERTPLLSLLQAADGMAAGIVELSFAPKK